MTNSHCAGLALLTLATLPALPVSVAAQTVEAAPTNCCAEIYWVGWELGRLRSIASYTTPAYKQAASLHMQRLGTKLQAANESCCRFCEAWAEWPQIQDRIRAATKELLDSPRSDAVETRRVFREWVESRPADLIEGLNRCDLEEGMPCKWLGLVDCARAYFELGVQLGDAMHVLSAASEGLVPTLGARQDGLQSLETAASLIASLRTGDAGSGSTGQTMRCDYLWDQEIGVERLLAEAVRQPDRHTDEQLADAATEANQLILRLLVEGRPDLGISPCPIGAAHDHAECERAEEHGHGVPADHGS